MAGARRQGCGARGARRRTPPRLRDNGQRSGAVPGAPGGCGRDCAAGGVDHPRDLRERHVRRGPRGTGRPGGRYRGAVAARTSGTGGRSPATGRGGRRSAPGRHVPQRAHPVRPPARDVPGRHPSARGLLHRPRGHAGDAVAGGVAPRERGRSGNRCAGREMVGDRRRPAGRPPHPARARRNRRRHRLPGAPAPAVGQTARRHPRRSRSDLARLGAQLAAGVEVVA